jgi:hypothetical protein
MGFIERIFTPPGSGAPPPAGAAPAAEAPPPPAPAAPPPAPPTMPTAPAPPPQFQPGSAPGAQRRAAISGTSILGAAATATQQARQQARGATKTLLGQ